MKETVDPEYGVTYTAALVTVAKTPEVIFESDNIWFEGDYVICEGHGLTNEGVAIFDLEGNLVAENSDWDFQCVDTGNGSFIVTDYSTCETYRLGRDLSRTETFDFLGYYESSYNGVTVQNSCPTFEDESYNLVYKGEKISDDHEFYDLSRIIMDGCEVYVFMDGLKNYSDELTFTAYVIDGNKCPFNDVSESHWAAPYITSCYNDGIMNGTGGGNFSPDMEVSRAQVVTTLWRLAGSPKPDGENSFADVADGQWYTDAVTWAAESGITNGVGGNFFAPERTVTRGVVAAIIYRYAAYMGEDTDGKADLSSFADMDELADWNSDAFAWCVHSGIITGKSGGGVTPARLAPTDVLTRAEIAAILCRY